MIVKVDTVDFFAHTQPVHVRTSVYVCVFVCVCGGGRGNSECVTGKLDPNYGPPHTNNHKVSGRPPPIHNLSSKLLNSV